MPCEFTKLYHTINKHHGSLMKVFEVLLGLFAVYPYIWVVRSCLGIIIL